MPLLNNRIAALKLEITRLELLAAKYGSTANNTGLYIRIMEKRMELQDCLLEVRMRENCKKEPI